MESYLTTEEIHMENKHLKIMIISMAKIKKNTYNINVGKDAEQLELYFFAGEAQNDTTIRGDSLVLYNKAEQSLTIGCSNCAPLCLSNSFQNLYPHKN